ncbi:MAG: hypothetical protein AB9888_13370 [Bacteroidales bacterium]
MNNIHPKILIFSQTFNNFSGGGITLTNLFSGWPRDRVAVVSYSFMLTGVSTDICDTYYQLGKDEIHWKFPFSLIKNPQRSGIVESEPQSRISGSDDRAKRKPKLSSILFNRFVKLVGLDHYHSCIYLSDRLLSWLEEYKPELLYFQISNRESIVFARNLVDHLGIPSVIHMMDDWPSSIADGSIFRNYWKGKIGKELQQLMNKVDLHLSICDEMSEEYKNRYGYNFYAFHNTIELDRWMRSARKDLNLNIGTKSVLFSGRIGKGIQQSLIEFAEALDSLRAEGIDITFEIQSPRSDPGILDQIKRYECVKINPPAEYARIPEIYSRADILAIVNDFHPDGIKFLKFSMPTKAPEYMISGTPILVYASGETALFKFFHHNKCGHCVGKQSMKEIADGIKILLQDMGYREELSKNAVTYAKAFFDSNIVRQKFQALLAESANLS